MVSGYHTLTFQMAADDHSGFRFASLKAASLVEAGDLYLEASMIRVEDITTAVEPRRNLPCRWRC